MKLKKLFIKKIKKLKKLRKIRKIKKNKKLRKIKKLKKIKEINKLNERNKIKELEDLKELNRLEKLENLTLYEKSLIEKVSKAREIQHKELKKRLIQKEIEEIKRIKFLKQKEEDQIFNEPFNRNATTFDTKRSFKDLKKRHIRRIQYFYRKKFRRERTIFRKLRRIPKTKKYKTKLLKAFLHKKKIIKYYKRFSFVKYIYFFKLFLKTRLKLFNLKNDFKFIFLNKLKNLIKNILFKTKTSFYKFVNVPFNNMNIYTEYKLWYLHYKKMQKIPIKLINLYSKFYFNKLLFSLKIKANFLTLYNKYLQARTKVKYFNIRQSKKRFKKKKIKKCSQRTLYKIFKSHMKFFMASRSVIFSLIHNGSFYMYYKLYQLARNNSTIKNNIVLGFLNNLRKNRVFYKSKNIRYHNFFFIYWAKKFYGYKVYGNYKHKFDEFYILNKYFKFFKSKTFFFNYLLNFIFSYIQKINLNIFNYIFILNQYKTKLIIDTKSFYKYLILFFFKKNHYLNFFSIEKKFNFMLPTYFSYFSLFFKQLSIELTNWYSFVNNNYSTLHKTTYLFNTCFILHNTIALYLHYKYKYLYYYRVYNFYIFYIFYYLYNHLFKVYKKLKLKNFKLSYDLIKNNEYNRYYLGLRTRMLILTIRNKYKHGFTVEKIFRNLKFFLREAMTKKELAGYYISIRGRYKRSSRSNKLIIKKGVYSFNKIDLKIDSSYGTLNTKYGIAGIKVIFAFK